MQMLLPQSLSEPYTVLLVIAEVDSLLDGLDFSLAVSRAKFEEIPLAVLVSVVEGSAGL